MGQIAPGLLSRGYFESHPTPNSPRDAPSQSGRDATLDSLFEPYAGVFSGYDSGVPTLPLDRAGGSFQEIDGGFASYKKGRSIEYNLNYRFDLRHYTHASRLDRMNQAADLDVRFRVSRAVLFIVRDQAASFSYDNSVSPASGREAAGEFFAGTGPAVVYARTIAENGTADLVVSPSARTSFSAGGGGFLIEHQFTGLIDGVGWRAHADIAHRYSRHKTVSLSYSFTHFSHTRSFGGADYAVVAAGHSMRLGRRSELDLLAGAGRLQSAGLRSVTLDPEISRLLGISAGIETFHLNTWSPHLMAAWFQGIGRAELRAQFNREITDGGGLTGLARRNEGTLSLSKAHARQSWEPAAHLSIRTYRSLDTLLFSNTTASAGLSVARTLSSRTQAVLRYDFGFYNYAQGLLQNFHRHQFSAGVIYCFRDRPNW